MLRVDIVREKRIDHIDNQVLTIEPRIHLLLGCQHLIDSCVKTIGVRRYRDKGLVIGLTYSRAAQIGHRVVLIQQSSRKRIDVRNCVVRKRLTCCRIPQNREGTGEIIQIALPVLHAGHCVLFRL